MPLLEAGRDSRAIQSSRLMASSATSSTLTIRSPSGEAAASAARSALLPAPGAPPAFFESNSEYNLAEIPDAYGNRVWSDRTTSGVVRIWIDSEFVTVGNIGYNGSANGPWLLIKLVADFVNGNYVRALIGHLELDLTDYALDSSVVAQSGWATFWLKCTAVNAVTNDGYIGHVAGTVDEP